jgi:hypothetical protein
MTVDRNALRTNQVAILVVVAVAFVLDAPWLVLLLGLALEVGALDPRFSVFQQFYHRVLRGRVVRPDTRPDDPAPHRFAQGLGGAFLLVASVALLGGATVLGWVLAWLVAALAAVNLTTGFCAGCFVFYQLARLGVVRRS